MPQVIKGQLTRTPNYKRQNRGRTSSIGLCSRTRCKSRAMNARLITACIRAQRRRWARVDIPPYTSVSQIGSWHDDTVHGYIEMSEHGQTHPRLSHKEARRFAKSTYNEFRWLEAYGPTGALKQFDVTFTASKSLQPSAMSSWGLRLLRHNQILDLSVLCELERRRAVAHAGLLSFSASAQLHILSQSRRRIRQLLFHR